MYIIMLETLKMQKLNYRKQKCYARLLKKIKALNMLIFYIFLVKYIYIKMHIMRLRSHLKML